MFPCLRRAYRSECFGKMVNLVSGSLWDSKKGRGFHRCVARCNRGIPQTPENQRRIFHMPDPRKQNGIYLFKLSFCLPSWQRSPESTIQDALGKRRGHTGTRWNLQGRVSGGGKGVSQSHAFRKEKALRIGSRGVTDPEQRKLIQKVTNTICSRAA